MVDEARPSTPKATVPPPSLALEAVHTPFMAHTSSSSLHYTQFKKTPQSLFGPPAPIQLRCDNHPFFEVLHPLLDDLKSFYKNVLAVEEDIFKRCVSWNHTKCAYYLNFLVMR